jgi:predicted O-methyltransferase YrrM
MHSDELKQYLTGIIPSRDEEILKIENYAKEHQVPIMDLIGMETLLSILRINKPKRILEIGAAIGYSAIRMAISNPETEIITIEKDPLRFDEAIHNVKKLELQNKVKVILGDALEIGEVIQGYAPYDVIFIDAAKGKYQAFFELFSTMLKPGGIILSDNVLFKGLVAKPDESLETKRVKKLVQKIRDYNTFLMDHPEYITTILPVGDGIAISIKK